MNSKKVSTIVFISILFHIQLAFSVVPETLNLDLLNQVNSVGKHNKCEEKTTATDKSLYCTKNVRDWVQHESDRKLFANNAHCEDNTKLLGNDYLPELKKLEAKYNNFDPARVMSCANVVEGTNVASRTLHVLNRTEVGQKETLSQLWMLDALLGNEPMKGVTCDVYESAEVRKNCNELKVACKNVDTKQALSGFVENANAIDKRSRELEYAIDNRGGAEKENALEEMNYLKMSFPWAFGEKFKKFRDISIEKAVTEQLKADRPKLEKVNRDLYWASRCALGKPSVNCSYEDIAEALASVPSISPNSNEKDPMKLSYIYNQCRIDGTMARDRKNGMIIDITLGVATIPVTFGFGFITMGIRAGLVGSRYISAARGVGAATMSGVDAYFLKEMATSVGKDCFSDPSKLLTAKSGESASCSIAKELSVYTENKFSSCLISSASSLVGVGALAVTTRAALKGEKAVAASAKSAKTPEELAAGVRGENKAKTAAEKNVAKLHATSGMETGRGLDQMEGLYSAKGAKNEFKDALNEVCKKGGTVVEMGAGSMKALAQLRAKCPGVRTAGISVETSSESIVGPNGEKIHEVFKGYLDTSVASKMPKADVIYDTYGVMAYTDKPLEALVTYADRLKVGGKAVIHLGNGGDLFGRNNKFILADGRVVDFATMLKDLEKTNPGFKITIERKLVPTEFGDRSRRQGKEVLVAVLEKKSDVAFKTPDLNQIQYTAAPKGQGAAPRQIFAGEVHPEAAQAQAAVLNSVTLKEIRAESLAETLNAGHSTKVKIPMNDSSLVVTPSTVARAESKGPQIVDDAAKAEGEYKVVYDRGFQASTNPAKDLEVALSKTAEGGKAYLHLGDYYDGGNAAAQVILADGTKRSLTSMISNIPGAKFIEGSAFSKPEEALVHSVEVVGAAELKLVRSQVSPDTIEFVKKAGQEIRLPKLELIGVEKNSMGLAVPIYREVK
ncbi:MAG: hypothetical protein ABL930_06585 [Pseudobdellovibrio sp.]